MGPLGWQETIFIFILALLIFGPKKLPELGKTIGKAMTEFRRASSELKSTWDREMASIEQEQNSLREVSRSYENEINSSISSSNDSTYNYDYDYGYGESYDSPYDDSASQSGSSTESKASDQADGGTPGTVSASAPQDADSAAGDAQTETGEAQPEATVVAEASVSSEQPAAAPGNSETAKG